MRKQVWLGVVGVGCVAVLGAGCASGGVYNAGGVGVVQMRADERGFVRGTGIESQDLVSVTDKMARSILSTPEVQHFGGVPRVALQPVVNKTRFRIDKDIFLAEIRLGLNRHAQGKVRFVALDRFGIRQRFSGAGRFVPGERQGAIIGVEESVSRRQERTVSGEGSMRREGASVEGVEEGGLGEQGVTEGSLDGREVEEESETRMTRFVREAPVAGDRVEYDREIVYGEGVRTPDFILTGELRGQSARTSAGLSDTVYYYFQLIDAQTLEVLWEDGDNIKKQGLEDAAYR